MRFSIVNGEKREAEKGLTGICIGCEQPVIPKCGPIKIHHWAHKSQCECDHWWENETEWHRSWKNNFPTECQEIRHRAEDGEWHIADVKTKQGSILEFQHSFLKAEERFARNEFYGDNLVWVVDGLRREKDKSQFDLTLKDSQMIHQNIQLIRLPSSIEKCSLLKEWSECNTPVFFDFGIELPLWCLLPKSSKGILYAGPFLRQNFIDLHNGVLNKNGQNFQELMKILNEIVVLYENPLKQTLQHSNQSLVNRRPYMQRQIEIPSNPSRRFINYLNRSPRRRGRF